MSPLAVSRPVIRALSLTATTGFVGFDLVRMGEAAASGESIAQICARSFFRGLCRRLLPVLEAKLTKPPAGVTVMLNV
jgi:hypothetical protein